MGTNEFNLFFKQKYRFRSPIDPTSLFVQIVEMRKTARQACQAVGFGVMAGSGPVPNRLPHDFLRKTTVGGDAPRWKYLFGMIILTAEFVKSRWRYLSGSVCANHSQIGNHLFKDQGKYQRSILHRYSGIDNPFLNHYQELTHSPSYLVSLANMFAIDSINLRRQITLSRSAQIATNNATIK